MKLFSNKNLLYLLYVLIFLLTLLLIYLIYLTYSNYENFQCNAPPDPINVDPSVTYTNGDRSFQHISSVFYPDSFAPPGDIKISYVFRNVDNTKTTYDESNNSQTPSNINTTTKTYKFGLDSDGNTNPYIQSIYIGTKDNSVDGEANNDTSISYTIDFDITKNSGSSGSSDDSIEFFLGNVDNAVPTLNYNDVYGVDTNNDGTENDTIQVLTFYPKGVDDTNSILFDYDLFSNSVNIVNVKIVVNNTDLSVVYNNKDSGEILFQKNYQNQIDPVNIIDQNNYSFKLEENTGPINITNFILKNQQTANDVYVSTIDLSDCSRHALAQIDFIEIYNTNISATETNISNNYQNSQELSSLDPKTLLPKNIIFYECDKPENCDTGPEVIQAIHFSELPNIPDSFGSLNSVTGEYEGDFMDSTGNPSIPSKYYLYNKYLYNNEQDFIDTTLSDLNAYADITDPFFIAGEIDFGSLDNVTASLRKLINQYNKEYVTVCADSDFGCCSDGRTARTDKSGSKCPPIDETYYQYGYCKDGLTLAMNTYANTGQANDLCLTVNERYDGSRGEIYWTEDLKEVGFKYITVNDDGQHIWGINNDNKLKYRNGFDNSWDDFDNSTDDTAVTDNTFKIIEVSGDARHLWAIDINDKVYYKFIKDTSITDLSLDDAWSSWETPKNADPQITFQDISVNDNSTIVWGIGKPTQVISGTDSGANSDAGSGEETKIYYRLGNADGSVWIESSNETVPSLKQISIDKSGQNVWGNNNEITDTDDGVIYHRDYNMGFWSKENLNRTDLETGVTDKYKHIDVSGENRLWAINQDKKPYFKENKDSDWFLIDKENKDDSDGIKLEFITSSDDGNHVWGITTDNRLFYRAGYKMST